MKRTLKLMLLLGLALLLAACAMPAIPTPDSAEPEAPAPTAAAGGMGMGMGRRMGMGMGMMERHSAAIPAPYADLASPIPASAEVLEEGAEIYTAQCAVCHGDGGMGDGPTAAVLDPAPAPIAHTSQMMSDAYLFWRVSEGGVPFETAMPVWKELLSEEERWSVIHYVRGLGSGQVIPRRGMGGAAFDPQVEAAQQREMLDQAVAQSVITQAEADTFAAVHDALDAYRAANPTAFGAGNPEEQQAALLAALVAAGSITQAQADAFLDIHQRLHEAGLM
ncbi:MAG: cytochrome c [Caldilineales bacterium]|nr:cytochrome c [Caldilineales bacterium]